MPGHPTRVLPWALRVLQQSGHPVLARTLSVPRNLHLHAGVSLLPGHATGESQGIQGWYILQGNMWTRGLLNNALLLLN